MSKQTSVVAHQVMWNRLISVVEEQAQALVRTAFSTSVREAGDLSAGIYAVNKRQIALTAGFVGWGLLRTHNPKYKEIT